MSQRKRKSTWDVLVECDDWDRLFVLNHFKVCCKTLEFHTHLNLPAVALDIIGKSSKRIIIEAAHSGWEFDCQYEYRYILPTNHPICRISEGWREVVDFFKIGQGDTLVFQRDRVDDLKFHLSIEKHPNAVKVEPGVWIWI